VQLGRFTGTSKAGEQTDTFDPVEVNQCGYLLYRIIEAEPLIYGLVERAVRLEGVVCEIGIKLP
jgi:hypothetical protein